MTYTNELEVEVDFSDVDPNLLDESSETTIESVGASLESDNSSPSENSSDYEEPKVGLGTDKPKSAGVGVGSKFFKK